MSIPKFLLLPATYCMIFMYQVEWQTRFCKQLKATVTDIVVCNANLTTGDRELQKFLSIKKSEENGEKRDCILGDGT